jgi:hypothetical protein
MVYSKVVACLHVGSPSLPHDFITFIYRVRERVLFIGTQFSNLYTAVEVVFNPIFCSWQIFLFDLFIDEASKQLHHKVVNVARTR